MTDYKVRMREAQERLLQKAKEGLMTGAEAMRALKPVVDELHERIKEAQNNE